jgi:DNA polymerase-3 subunit gamma/tau
LSYQVLARKYRPQTFEEVVGQAPIVTTLQNAVAQNRIHHAYLFSGLRGVGKTTVARLLAKALNCAEGPTATPCNRCASCREIAESRSLDVLEIDGASNRGIDAVRELRETVRYAPARDRYKVTIIDEVHMLTPEAWNALLKTLEEPPPHVVFLFATTEHRKIPLTILSRCQHFEFRKIAESETIAHLKRMAEGEKATVPAAVLGLIARMAEGSLRDAQSALDQVIAFSGTTVTEERARTILGVIDRDLVTGFYDAVRARDVGRLVGIVATVFERGYLPVQFLEDLMAHGRDLLLARALPDPSPHLEGDPAEVRALVERAAAFTEDEILRLLELLTREEPRLKNTGHPRYLFEALAIKLARLADLKPLEEILARLEGTAGEPGEAAPRPSAPGAPAPGAPGPPRSPARRTLPAEASPAGETAPRSAAPAPAAERVPTTPAAERAAPAPSVDRAAPADPAGDPAAGDTALVETILRRVHDERAALGGFLAQAAWVEIAGEALQIAFQEKHGFFREKVEGRESVEYLKRVTREVTGRDLAIKVTAVSPAVLGARPAAASSEAAEARRRRLTDEAMREPILKTIVEALGAEVVEVDGV